MAAHLCMNLWSSVIRSDFISQVPRITTPGRHWMGTRGVTVGGLMRAKTQTRWKKKRDRVGEQEGEKEKRREWQSDGGNTIKGNECHSVIPTVWSRCLCQLSWQPEVRSLSPSHWGKSRLQVPNAGLVMRSARHDGWDHHFLDKEPQLLHARKSRDQGSF